MPGRTITDKKNLILWVLLRQFFEECIHALGTAIWHDQKEIISCHWLNCAIDIPIALQSNHPSEQPKVTLTVRDMADLLGISMPKAYELTHQPGFPVIRVGRKALINKDMLLAWMAEQSAPKGE